MLDANNGIGLTKNVLLALDSGILELTESASLLILYAKLMTVKLVTA